MLNHQIKIYVPSTINGNQPATDLAACHVENALSVFAKIFGGATAIQAIGAYISQTLGLIKEPVTIVYSFTDDKTAADSIPRVMELARLICLNMRQECVSVELDNELIFVNNKQAA